MLRITQIKLPLNHSETELRRAVVSYLAIENDDVIKISVFRRGIDARKNTAIWLIYTLDVEIVNEAEVLKRMASHPDVRPTPDMRYQLVAKAPPHFEERPVVIGMGPCGLFAGLVLAEMGFRPIILERGKIVRERTKDTFALWRKRELNPNSNVQFGEGGAGTFSDGKLHSLISDPAYRSRKVLTEFVEAGAPEEILYVSKPHIGTLRLVSMVEKMRAKIIRLGGDIRFQEKVVKLAIKDNCIQGVHLESGEYLKTNHVVLAIGHSARETFSMLHEHGVYIEPKPFSVGFRIEHPQSMIDTCRFGKHAKNPILGAADYKLSHHCSNGRTVYSFCMCPGGTVVAATSEVGHVVSNGMSQYSRVERNANSGIVVGITPDDYPGHPLAGIDFQRRIEQQAFILGGSNYDAPGQLVGDFLHKKASTNFGAVIPSYKPGVKLGDLSSLLPSFAIDAIREALPVFERSIPGYARYDAVLTGVETRTSSPIRIKRDESYQSINTKGLYPAGEGAGYAGGILSAAVDGLKVGEAVALDLCR